MTIRLHAGDLPADLDLGSVVAIDTETLGLEVGRDRLCLVQLSRGDGSADLVQVAPGQKRAPNLEKLLADPNVLKLFHFGRFDIAMLCHAFGVMAVAGLLHQDRLQAGAHLHRPSRPQGPHARAARRRDLQAAAVLRLGRGDAQRSAARLRRLRRAASPRAARQARRDAGARGARRAGARRLRLSAGAGAARPRRLRGDGHLRPRFALAQRPQRSGGTGRGRPFSSMATKVKGASVTFSREMACGSGAPRPRCGSSSRCGRRDRRGVDAQHVADLDRADEGHRLDGDRHHPSLRAFDRGDAAGLVHLAQAPSRRRCRRWRWCRRAWR